MFFAVRLGSIFVTDLFLGRFILYSELCPAAFSLTASWIFAPGFVCVCRSLQRSKGYKEGVAGGSCAPERGNFTAGLLLSQSG